MYEKFLCALACGRAGAFERAYMRAQVLYLSPLVYAARNGALDVPGIVKTSLSDFVAVNFV